MNNDPADARAKARSHLQLARELETDRRSLPHPSVGGSRGYPVWFRMAELERHAAGEETTASKESLYRWNARLIPYRMTGNRGKTDLIGTDLVLLSVVLTVHCTASHNEMAMYVYSEGGGLHS